MSTWTFISSSLVKYFCFQDVTCNKYKCMHICTCRCKRVMYLTERCVPFHKKKIIIRYENWKYCNSFIIFYSYFCMSKISIQMRVMTLHGYTLTLGIVTCTKLIVKCRQFIFRIYYCCECESTMGGPALMFKLKKKFCLQN